jgi:hypothetical protein
MSDQLLSAAKAALALLIQYEEKIEGEWGSGRSIRQLRADGLLSKELVELEAAIADRERVTIQP